MFKFLVKLIATMAVAAVLLTPAVWAMHQAELVIGDTYEFTSYCTSEEAVIALADRVTRLNDIGYLEVMKDPDIACVDIRFHPIQAVMVEVVERTFSITRTDGLTFAFWKIEDMDGNVGYVWTFMPDGG